MGIALGDIDGDLDLDLFLSHLIEETNTLYVNLGGAAGASDGFDDRAAEAGLAAPSTPYTGFGTAFFDADNDGDLDLAVVNGAVKRRPAALSNRDDWFWRGYAEPNLLMLGDGAGAFVDVSDASGDFGSALDVSRALVPFDLEGDGDLDLLVANLEGPARIYRNESTAGPGRLGESAGRRSVVAADSPRRLGRRLDRRPARSSPRLALGRLPDRRRSACSHRPRRRPGSRTLRGDLARRRRRGVRRRFERQRSRPRSRRRGR